MRKQLQVWALIVVIEAPVMSRKINTMRCNTMVIEIIG